MYILQSVIGVGLDIVLLLYLLKGYSYKRNKILAFFYCVIYLILIIKLNKILGSSILRLVVYYIFVWFYIIMFYENITALLSVKLAAIYFVIMQISEMLVLGFIIILGDYKLYSEVLSGNKVKTILIILITKSLNIIIATLIGRLRKEKKQQHHVSFTILFPLFFAFISLIVNTQLLLEVTDNKIIMGIIFTTSLIMFAAVSYTVFFEYYESAKEREQYIERLVTQNRQQYKLFQEKMLNDQKIKKMHHDIKNHILYLRFCFENVELENGIEYANGLLDKLASYNISLHTGSGMLDCLISEIQQKCSINNIIFKIDINLHEKCFMSDFDVCTLFGNILNNAYEATMRLEEHENKKIVFKMSTIDSFIVIKVTNHTLVNKDMKSYLFLTSKSDAENHGLGMKNIDDIINKYNGIKKISFQEDLFILKIMLPIP